MVPVSPARAQFVNGHAQKPALVTVTHVHLARTLANAYPLLVMTDCALDRILWLGEDFSSTCIYSIMVIMALRPALNLSTGYLNVWIGIVSVITLVLSVIYYTQTLYYEIREKEPPTLDDIALLLECVMAKLESLRKELSWSHFHQTLHNRIALRLAVILSPFQLILMRYHWISPNQYVLMILGFFALRHSEWFQAAQRLFWRSLWVRRLYFLIFPEDNRHIHSSTVLNSQELISLLEPTAQYIELPELERHGLEHITVVTISINENQRKWGEARWSGYMLPYERSPFDTLQDTGKPLPHDVILLPCVPPELFESELPSDWEPLDEEWMVSEWTYSDSEWNLTGNEDSLESFTRTRKWKRRIYKVVHPKKSADLKKLE